MAGVAVLLYESVNVPPLAPWTVTIWTALPVAPSGSVTVTPVDGVNTGGVISSFWLGLRSMPKVRPASRLAARLKLPVVLREAKSPRLAPKSRGKAPARWVASETSSG
jgi:hypothetical protein